MVTSETESVSDTYLNLARLKEISENDNKFIRDILQIFRINTPEIMDNLASAAASNDHETLRAVAHRYKSSVNILGNPELLKEVKLLEEAAGEGGDMKKLKGHVAVIKRITNGLLGQVEVELDNLPS